MLRRILIATTILISSPTFAQTPQETAMSQSQSYTSETVQGWVSDYFEGARSMSAEQWASAFAPDAVLDDPVGEPIKDTPEAILQQGENFVSAFESVGLTETFVHTVGREAVAKWEARGTLADGSVVIFEGINVFTFNADGKIIELRGFFTPPGS